MMASKKRTLTLTATVTVAASALLLGALGSPASSAPATRALVPSNSSQNRPELQKVLVRLVTGAALAPGATAYVSGPNGTWGGSAGIANLKTGEPMPLNARMRLESVSKAWTATLILQLAGEGKLRLDDAVAHWLPGLLPYGKLISIRQLLNHTAGLTDNNDIGADPDSYIRQVRDAGLRAELLATEKRVRTNPALDYSPMLWVRFVAALPLRSTPGSQYHYSNIGYEIAGLIAEKVSGKSLPALYDERIIKPLKLKSAAYNPQGSITGQHPRGYLRQPDGTLIDVTAWHGGIGAEGGIVASAHDEARFLQALMQGKLLGPQQLGAMKTTDTALGSSYALGLVVDRTPCGVAYQHNGGGAGFKTSVFVSGDGARVAVLLLNGNNGHTDADSTVYAAAKRLYCAG